MCEKSSSATTEKQKANFLVVFPPILCPRAGVGSGKKSRGGIRIRVSLLQRHKHYASTVLQPASNAHAWNDERLKKGQKKQTYSKLKWIYIRSKAATSEHFEIMSFHRSWVHFNNKGIGREMSSNATHSTVVMTQKALRECVRSNAYGRSAAKH